jgi:N-methylhydantoinase A/oxoprolinase/acetone carboxylase beta subunit
MTVACASGARAFRAGFDVGGTFTDLVVANRSGTIRTSKVLTTSDDIMVGVLKGFDELLRSHGIEPSEINDIIVGATTVVTNLIIERKGARTGLIATRGFADVIEIGRELRYDVYDLKARFPELLVPRALRMEVDERIDYRGKVVRALDVSEIESAADRLSTAGVTSVAVSLLHGYVNPVHERLIKSTIERVAPRMHVSLSVDVLPEIREYERTVATVLNAYVRPYIGGYLQRLEKGLGTLFGKASLRLMQSNGGMISRAYAELLPLRMLESGPAAGALAAGHLAGTVDLHRIVAFDMGGTTAKTCLISGGEPEVTTEFETARVHRFKRGSGLPVKLPIIDLVEIGSGGGSIAHIDQTGILKVGPASAGADPGPACYGLGGNQPTVTDAALILGYLDRDATLSGVVRLDYAKAHAAIGRNIAEPLGISVQDAAVGIYRIACEQMAAAAKIHAAEKGRDLREYTLVAFGGAGPIHACDVARRLRCQGVAVPPDAGVYSAIGLLLAPDKVDAVRSNYARLREIDWPGVAAMLGEMEAEITRTLGSAGVSTEEIKFTASADMRYVGQGFEVTAPIPYPLEDATPERIALAFQEAYAAKFGRALQSVDIEAVSWRMQGVATSAWLGSVDGSSPSGGLGERSRRPVYFLEGGRFVDTPVYRSSSLARDTSYRGPMLIEQAGSTIVIGPGDAFQIDADANVRVSIGANASGQLDGSR